MNKKIFKEFECVTKTLAMVVFVFVAINLQEKIWANDSQVFELAKAEISVDEQDSMDYSGQYLSDETYDGNASFRSGDSVELNGGLTPQEIKDRENKTLDLLAKIDAFSEQDEKLRSDSAKAHYNMGNIYFQKGDYEVAAREYYQAVTLMPDDPDAHFNLALVSGEYLNDHKTALKHYKLYLYLNPGAKDIDFVREKITSAQLHIEDTVNSPLEKKDK